MSLNQKQINIKKMLKNYSIETTPNVYDKYGSFKELVPLKNSIYVTYLPDEDAKRVIETSKKLSSSYMYDTKYIEYLIDKLQTGEYELEDLEDQEQEQIRDYLQDV